MKLTVRDVLEQLEAVARDLPLGLDSPVVVAMCDERDMEVSRELEIDTLFEVDLAGKMRDAAAMLRGHPHIDKAEGRGTHFPGVVADADEALRRWTEGPDSE
jgi:hypothetical protein